MADNQFRGIEGQDCPAIRVTQDAGCPAIRVRITGGGETPEAPLSDVNFYDYDGKRVASYTAADFAALTEMPANPSHQGLTAQGWNWSLADAQAYVAAYGKLNIGQQYITDDGLTRFYINIEEPGRMTVPLNFNQSVSEGVLIDWGDGNTQTIPGTGYLSTTHTFPAPGDYIITLKVQSGTAGLGGYYNAPAIGFSSNAGRVYTNMLQKAEIGEKMEFTASSFCNCHSLKTISIPISIATFPNSCFSSCYALKCVSIPDSLPTLGASVFSSCSSITAITFPKVIASMGNYVISTCSSFPAVTLPQVSILPQYMVYTDHALNSIVISAGVTTIDISAFNTCLSLVKVTIPASVTTIGNTAFANCYGLAEVHIKATTPPTLGSNVFQNLPADCKIYVPASAVATYQGATGWIDYASQIVGE